MNEVPFQPEPEPNTEFPSSDSQSSDLSSFGAAHLSVDSGAAKEEMTGLPPHSLLGVEASENVESFPGFYPLHPDVIRADRIAGLIFFAIVALGMFVALVVKIFTGGFDGLFFGLLGGAGIVALWLLWMAIFWPKLEYRRTRWRLDDVGLEIHKGVLWRHRRVVPWARVQHADVGQGPLQRMYDLATLTVHTAGTHGSSVDLSGLHHQVALHLRDRLVRQKLTEQNQELETDVEDQPSDANSGHSELADRDATMGTSAVDFLDGGAESRID